MPGEVGHRPDVILYANDPLLRQVMLVALAALGGVVLTAAMVYVGKKRGV